MVLPCFRIDARRRAGQYAHFNERFRWSRSSPEIDVPEPMFIRARKAPDFPPVFTVASGLSGLIPGGLVLCSQRALLPHRQPLQGASSQSASEHARDTRRHQWPVTWPIRKMCAHDAPRAYASAAVQAGWIAHVRAQLTGPTPTPKPLQKKSPRLHADFTF